MGYRYLGAYPLSPDNAVEGHGYGEWSGDVHYALESGWSAAIGIFNISGKKADAAEFWYVDRLRSESAAGIADIHAHPLEPRTARLTIAKRF